MKLLKLTEQMLQTIAQKLTSNPPISNNITDYLQYPKQKIIFTEEANAKMWALIDNCPQEIGWHGLVRKLDDNIYEIYDIIVYPQVVTSTSITCDKKKFNDWMQSYIMTPDDTFDHIRLHGHSHVNMATPPSSVDTQLQMDTLTKLPANDYYIYIICNKEREIWCTIYDTERNIAFEKKDIEIITNKYNQWAEEQIKEYLSKPTVKTIKISDYKPYLDDYITTTTQIKNLTKPTFK